MFAPRGTPASQSEEPNSKLKDVVLCQSSPEPLLVPGALLETLWEQINQGLQTAAGRTEVGGLLLGSRSETGGIRAEAVVPIPIEHHFGPSFRLSPADLEALAALMASLQTDASKPVVGFYRSRTGNGKLSGDSEDAVLSALEQSHPSFQSDFRYFVVFTPLSQSRMTASAAFRTDEGWDDWQQVMLLLNQPAAPVPEASLPATDSRPHSPPLTWTPALPPAVPAFAGRAGMHAAWYGACAVLLALIVWGVHLRNRPVPPPVAPHPGFAASWEGYAWKLTWDRAAVEALAPIGAVLSIHDGAEDERTNLTPSDLSRGTFFYKPRTSDLLFSLNIIMRGGQTTEEHVRVMEGPRPVRGPEDSVSEIAEERPAPRGVAPSPEVDTRRSVRRRPAQKVFVFPRQGVNSKGREPSPALPPPPPVVRRAGPDVSAGVPFAETCCTAIATYEPAGPHGFERVIHKVPVLRRLGSTRAGGKGFVPPRPLHEIQFAVPPDASPVLREKRRLEIKASVDASGRVTSVKLLSPRDEDLVKLAAYAANGWRFEPAHWNDQPVPAEVILHFNFDTSLAAQTGADPAKDQ